MAKPRALEIAITADAKQAKKAFAEMERAAGQGEKRTSKALDGIKGKVLDLGVAAGAAFAFNEWNEAEKVGRQTEAVLASTGAAAWTTADAVSDLAGEISKKTAIDDEAIQVGQNWLLTFKKVRNEAGEGNDIFDRTTRTMVDLSVAMGSDSKTAANLLGKALNDPVKGVTALSKVGVTFTAQQKEQIKALAETGDVLGAQKIILAEVESQVKGSAEAQATSYDRAKVAAGNLAETVGGVLAPAVETVADKAAIAADWFGELEEWQQRLILGAGGATYAWLRWGDSLDEVAAGQGRVAKGARLLRDNMGKAAGAAAAGVAAYNLTYEALERLFDQHADADELLANLEGLAKGGADVSDVAEALDKDIEGLAGAFRRAKGAPSGIGDSLRYLTTTWDGFKGGGNMRDALNSVEDLDRGLAAMVEAGNVEDAAEAHSRLIATLIEEGLTIDEIVPLLPTYYGAVETAGKKAGIAEQPVGAMNQALIEQGDAAGEAAEGLRNLGGVVEESMGDLADAADETAGAFDRAMESIRNYYSELYAPYRAAIDAEAKLDGITASIIENGRELDINTEKGRANNEALLDYIETAVMASTQTDDVAGSMARYRERLMELLEKLGFTSGEVENLNTLFALTPKDILLNFTSNAPAVRNEVELLRQASIEANQLLNDFRGPYGMPNLSGGGDHRMDGMARGRGRAVGGPVQAGVLYPINERGLEGFVPSVDGTVIPAPSMRRIANASGGGGNTYITVRVEGTVVSEGDLVRGIRSGLDRATAESGQSVRVTRAGLAGAVPGL